MEGFGRDIHGIVRLCCEARMFQEHDDITKLVDFRLLCQQFIIVAAVMILH